MRKVIQNEEYLQLYKLHAEFADRVSQRRERANQLYTGLLTGLMVVGIASLRLAPTDEPINMVLFLGLGILGVILSSSWLIIIRSYRQLNTGKFKSLHELEKQMSYPFFTREWEFLHQGRDYRRYWKLTVVEIFLPMTFFLASLLLILLYWII
ncbi:MAG: hypothetical protein OXF06_03675 [Bacteroidetes bacterium]|nr:hypothetical protein [Bacteroidota bacterium]